MASMQQVNDFAHKWLTLYKADSMNNAGMCPQPGMVRA